MTENELFSGNELVENVLQKVKSLVTQLSDIKESSYNYEFDQSICNDIYTYIQIIQTDCQRVKDSYNLFSHKDLTVQKIYGNIFNTIMLNNR